MEKLTHMISDRAREKKWKGMRAGRKGPNITHMMFADDLVLFAEAETNQINNILECLQDFGEASGHTVSKDKTQIYFSPNTSQRTRKEIYAACKFKQVEDLGRYLGAEISHPKRRNDKYKHLVERVRKRLQGWKASSLSLAGRITLVKAVTGTMALYPMQHDKIPTGTIKELEKLQRAFVWGEQGEVRRHHAVAWETLCKTKEEGGVNMKDLETMNEAFFMKLMWRMKTQPEELWVKVLKGKYEIERKEKRTELVCQGDSKLWKGIMSVEGKFQENVEYEIRNGESTRVWQDKWVRNEGELGDLAITGRIDKEDIRVKHLVDNEGQWDLADIENLLPPSVIWKIKRMMPPVSEAGVDIMRWRLTSEGEFSTASAYKWLRGSPATGRHNYWRTIWRLKVPERIRSFMWLVYHKRLTTKEVTSKWNGESNYCTICQEKPENLIHAIRDCPNVKHIWNQMIPKEWSAEVFRLEEKDWVQVNISTRDKSARGSWWPEEFAVACWHMWTWRNRKMHEVDFDTPKNATQVIARYLKNYQGNWDGETLEKRQVKMIMVGWEKPELGWCKINTDGSITSSGFGGCGGVIRGDQGEWLRGFSIKLGLCDAKTAEARGVLEGLKIAWQMGFKKIELECDALTVVTELKNKTGIKGCHLVSRKIADLLQEDWQVRIQHVYRESNRAADILAQMSIKQQRNETYWETPPGAVEELLRADLKGTRVPRAVIV